MNHSELILNAILFICWALTAYIGLGLLIVAGLFFYAWCRGWLTDETTPMDILDRICHDTKH